LADLPPIAAQDFSKDFITDASDLPEMIDYNLKVGNLRAALAATFEAEYNDNLTQVSTGRISDLILRPGVDTHFNWPLSDFNSLDLDLAAGWHFYLNHPEVDSNRNFLDISPGSQIAFKCAAGDFNFKLYDQFQYLIEPDDARFFDSSTAGIVSNAISLSRLENRAGASGLWDLDNLKIYGGYACDDVSAEKPEFKSLDRVAQTVYLSPMAQLAPGFAAGLLSACGRNDYAQSFQNNGRMFSLGPKAAWQLTENTAASADACWQRMDFDRNGMNGDASGVNTVNGHLKIRQQLNDCFSHSILAGRDSQLGTVTNAATVDSCYYAPEYRLSRKLLLKGKFGYEQVRETGPLGEACDRRVFGIGGDYSFSDKLNLRLNYLRTNQQSDLADRSFGQNQIILSVVDNF